MTSLKSRLRHARYLYSQHRTSARLHAYLLLKARAGLYDTRMCAYYRVNANLTPGCRKAVCRAYAAGLVPTSTTGGHHAPNSYHGRKDSKGRGRAVDFGLRSDLIGTGKGAVRLSTFQRKEFWRARTGRVHPIELIGPINNLIILRGNRTSLAEGTPLETQHDNHVHEAY